MVLSVPLQGFLIVEVLFFALLRDYLKQRGHCDINMSVADKLGHKTVQEGEKQRINMAAVHIGIRHQYDFIIAELRDIEVIAVSFGKAAAEGVDHRLTLSVGQNLVHCGFLHIQNLSADRKDGLVLPVSSHLGGTAGRISLDDENFAFLRIPAFAIGQLAVAVKGKFRLCQHICLGFFLRLPDFSRFFRTGDHRL